MRVASMSDIKAQPGPSMEGILAAIGRIIGEEIARVVGEAGLR
jgi:hypothetical protein